MIYLHLNFYNHEDANEPYTLPFKNTIDEMEVRLGGIIIQRFDIDELIVHFEQEYPYDILKIK